jgi:MFS family permease
LQTRLPLCLNRKMADSKRFSALSYRDFRLFWFGQIISITGTWMQSVAQGWLVYSLTKSPFYLGMVAAAASLPILLFTLPAGVLADRLPKRNLLLYTQAFSIVPALMLGILTSLKVIAVWQVALLAAVLGSINAVDIPTRQSFLAEMVGRGQVANAIALNSAAFNGARIIGPMIAGAVIASMGIPACFFLNALSFGAVILALSKMQTKGEMRVKSEGMIKDFRKGIGFVRGDREIVAVITLIGLFSLAGLPYISLLPVFAGGVFHKGATGYGFLMGASGIGALTAAVGIAARRSIQNPLKMMSVAVLCFSTALLAFSVSRIFWVSLVIIMLGGWGMVSYLALANSFIQMSVPDDLRGRVMSVYSFVFLGTVPIGNAIMGSVADRIGTTNAVTVGGAICIAGAVLFARKYGKKEIATP